MDRVAHPLLTSTVETTFNSHDAGLVIMHGSPTYIVRIPEEGLETDFDDMSKAIIAASEMYDPSFATPEIIDGNGTIVLD